MKTKRCGDIQIRIDMVDVMKSPQKCDPVVGNMPVLEAEVEKRKYSHDFKWAGES